MRTILRIALWGCFALLILTGLIYLGDDLYARSRGRPVEHLQVGRVYAAVNRYNQVEYSIGTPAIETCVEALMPHFGYTPCWYLQRHRIQQIGP